MGTYNQPLVPTAHSLSRLGSRSASAAAAAQRQRWAKVTFDLFQESTNQQQQGSEFVHKILVAALMCVSFQAFADECESVVALSKVVSTVVQDKNAVEQNAANFCSEYSKSTSAIKSKNFGASYKFLAASFGSAGASAEEVASRYCSASSNYSASNDAYRQYIESISPNAYSSYQRCLELTKRDMRFDINTASILPDEFSMSVGFASSAGRISKATVAYSASRGISCKWNGDGAKSVEIPTGGTAILECTRDDPKKPGFVNVVRTDASDSPLTLPWRPYDEKGNPVDVMSALQSRISVLGSQVDSIMQGEQETQTRLGKIEGMNDKTNARFEKIRFTKACVPVQNCGASPPACPSGFRDTGFTEVDSYRGGKCGIGQNCRVCYTVDE